MDTRDTVAYTLAEGGPLVRLVPEVKGKNQKPLLCVVEGAKQAKGLRLKAEKFPTSFPSGKESKDSFPLQPGTWNLKPETLLVGREAELAQLHGAR